MLEVDSLRGAGQGISTAYYLVHSMGRGGGPEGFAERERRAASNFARMAKEEGVDRVVYLGGLGDERSEHLRSRAPRRPRSREEGPPLVYFRAGMVVGAGSESYRTVRYLVERLPAMIAPSWLRNRTQPIAIDDVLEYLAQAAELPDAAGLEVQIGGPDVLSYSELLSLMADVLGKRRRPQLRVPFLTPRLSSLWIGLVTPVDAGVARPLIESLASETIVTDPEPARRFDVQPIGALEALRARGPRRSAADRHAVRLVELRTATASLALAEEFGIARGSRTTQSVVQLELEHDGIVGRGEASPIYYRGESIDSAADFLTTAAPPLLGDDPFALEAIEERLEDVDGEAAGKAALDAALHDWIGQRLGRAGLAPARALARGAAPPRSRSGSTRSRAPATARAARASSGP